MKDLGENIKIIREKNGITLEQVATYMGEKVQMVKMWEYGNTQNLDCNQIVKLSEVLKVSPSVLVGWEKE